MKAFKGIIVELENKHLAYNGVELDYNYMTKTATTEVFKEGVGITSDYNSPLYCPDRGVVVDSDDPQILVGDIVILEYFVVAKKLGTFIEMHQKDPHNEFEIVGNKIRIPVKTRGTPETYVYGIFRDGMFVPYNDFNIVRVVQKKDEKKVYTMHMNKHTQQISEFYDTMYCEVMYGEYAGMTCIFTPAYLLGEAQKSVIDDVEVRFIQGEYLLCEVEKSID